MSAEGFRQRWPGVASLFFRHNGFPAYLLGFALFFLSYPLNGSLVADIDLWVYLGAYNYYLEYLISLFTGADIGVPFYPNAYPYLNGEPCFSIFPLWLPFRLLGFNEVYSFYALYVLLFAFNAAAVFRLSRVLFPALHPGARWLSGLFFSCNNFMLANIDNPNTMFFAPGIWACSEYVLWLYHRKKTALALFVWGMLIQLFGSAYNFMYAGLFVLCLTVLAPAKMWRRFRQMPLASVASALVLFAGTAFYLYLLTVLSDKSQSYNYSNSLETVKFVSFATLDFIRVLPGNLYYHTESYFFWLMQYKSLFLGVLLSGLGIAGFGKATLRHPFLLLLWVIAMVIGAGTYFDWGSQRVLLPLGWLFETFDLYSFYRVPFRIFMLPVLILSLCAAIPLSYVLNRSKAAGLFCLMAATIFLLENVPLKRTHFDSAKYVEEAYALEKKFAAEPQSVFLFLPCGDFVNGQTYLINRSEYIVHYYQSKIRKNVVNGYISFFPPSRMELNEALLKFEKEDTTLRNYLKKYGVKTLVFYGEEWGFIKTGMKPEALRKLAKEEGLRLVER